MNNYTNRRPLWKLMASSFKNWLDFIQSGIIKLRLFKPKHMPEDPRKIQAKIDYLNNLVGGHWVAATGKHALTEVKGNDYNKLTFFPTRGIVIKVFMNQDTGEIRIFHARPFEKNA